MQTPWPILLLCLRYLKVTSRSQNSEERQNRQTTDICKYHKDLYFLNSLYFQQTYIAVKRSWPAKQDTNNIKIRYTKTNVFKQSKHMLELTIQDSYFIFYNIFTSAPSISSYQSYPSSQTTTYQNTHHQWCTHFLSTFASKFGYLLHVLGGSFPSNHYNMIHLVPLLSQLFIPNWSSYWNIHPLFSVFICIYVNHMDAVNIHDDYLKPFKWVILKEF